MESNREGSKQQDGNDVIAEAITRGAITEEQGKKIKQLLSSHKRQSRLQYATTGCIGSVSLLCLCGTWWIWKKYGGWGLLALATAYGSVGLGGTLHLHSQKRRLPASVAAALTTFAAPAAVFGLQQILQKGNNNSSSITSAAPSLSGGSTVTNKQQVTNPGRSVLAVMGVSTFVSGYLMLRRFGYPLLTLPMSLSLLCTGLDIGGTSKKAFWVYGIMGVAITRYIEKRYGASLSPSNNKGGDSIKDEDYMYWPYVVSVGVLCVGMLRSWVEGEKMEMLAGAHAVLGLLGVLWYRKAFLLAATPSLLYMHYVLYKGGVVSACVSGVLHALLALIGPAMRKKTVGVFGGVGVLVLFTRLAREVFPPGESFALYCAAVGLGGVMGWMQYDSYEQVLATELQHSLTNLWGLLRRRADRYI